MKHFLTVLVLLISLSMSAQFDVTSGEETGKMIKIEGKDYPIISTQNGSKYIICESPRTKNLYPVWIGEATDSVGVRISKKGKKFKIVLSKNSKNPYCQYRRSKKKLPNKV